VERAPRPDRRRGPRLRARARVLPVLILLACSGCGSSTASATDIAITLLPPGDALVVDREARLEFTLADAEGRVLPGGSLQIEANMTHPGMAPIVAPAVDEGGGRYRVAMRFTMAGEWVLWIKGTLPDRRPVDRRLEGVVSVRPSG
jgi:hypothetical protein